MLINIITIIARVIKKYIRSFSIKNIIKDATSLAKGVRIRIYKPALIRMLDELKPMIICPKRPKDIIDMLKITPNLKI